MGRKEKWEGERGKIYNKDIDVLLLFLFLFRMVIGCSSIKLVARSLPSVLPVFMHFHLVLIIFQIVISGPKSATIRAEKRLISYPQSTTRLL